MRPFLIDEHHPAHDPHLAGSIAAAQRYIEAEHTEAQHMSSWDMSAEPEHPSDSDGGWGPPPEIIVAAYAAGGAQHGGRRGGRRGRGRGKASRSRARRSAALRWGM